jgi:hypothetical protein
VLKTQKIGKVSATALPAEVPATEDLEPDTWAVFADLVDDAHTSPRGDDALSSGSRSSTLTDCSIGFMRSQGTVKSAQQILKGKVEDSKLAAAASATAAHFQDVSNLLESNSWTSGDWWSVRNHQSTRSHRSEGSDTDCSD